MLLVVLAARRRRRLVRPARTTPAVAAAAGRAATTPQRRHADGPHTAPQPKSRRASSTGRRSSPAAARAAVRAPAAILVDAGTGRVLWAERPHERRKIASLTKIMTATARAAEVPWSSTDHRRPARSRACRSCARGCAPASSVQGLEALLRAAPLLRERRREPARDLERRLGPRVPPPDERRGDAARAARHALHEPERVIRDGGNYSTPGTSRR